MGSERIAEDAVDSGARARIIGIDPGLSKCGFAVVYDDGERDVLEIVPTADVAARIERELAAGPVAAICIGDATTSASVVRLCKARWPKIPLAIVDERNTTFEARRAYYEDHPPRGLLKFVPRGMLVPPVALDDYAALLIVRRYLAGRAT